jgi:hypothetical protein
MIDDAVGFVNVMKRAISQTAHGRVIFFPSDVIVGSIQQFHRAVIAAGAIHSCIDRRVIVQVLAVIDRSPLDFVDGVVNFFDSVLLFSIHVVRGRKVFQVSAGVAQVRERVQVSRMPSRFVGEGQRGANCNEKHEHGTVSHSSHGFPRRPFGRMNSLIVNPELQNLTRWILRGDPSGRKLHRDMALPSICLTGGCIKLAHRDSTSGTRKIILISSPAELAAGHLHHQSVAREIWRCYRRQLRLAQTNEISFAFKAM